MSVNFAINVFAFLFTLMIFSYLIGDNPLFRIAIYTFVGISAGYVASVAIRQVLWPNLIKPLMQGFFSGPSAQQGALALPLFLSGLLIMKAWPPFSRLGMPAMGLLVGVSAAVAIGGGINGTLIPQINSTINSFDLRNLNSGEAIFDALIVLTGVLTTLVYFHFGARTRIDGTVRRFVIIESLAFIGSIFLSITLGVLFAGAYAAALAAFIERLNFIKVFLGVG